MIIYTCLIFLDHLKSLTSLHWKFVSYVVPLPPRNVTVAYWEWKKAMFLSLFIETSICKPNSVLEGLLRCFAMLENMHASNQGASDGHKRGVAFTCKDTLVHVSTSHFFFSVYQWNIWISSTLCLLKILNFFFSSSHLLN